MKRIAILGSTGSIGINTLRIARAHPKEFRVKVLAAKRNTRLLLKQAREFRPELVCLYDAEYVGDLEKELKRLKIRLVTGDQGLVEASRHKGVDQVVFAIVGAVGLLPLFAAVRSGKNVAVANKEPLVMAGALLMKESKRYGVSVFPIDSEHSALWQCLQGYESKSIKKLILTSSGGPFHKRKGTLAHITPKEALKHPKWKMGPKITVDSATYMNKGLEVIEAANLFHMPVERVEVVIHPEAIVHALVEFVDGSHLAHLGITDMRLPIQYALSYPERLSGSCPSLDLKEIGSLHFENPDWEKFPCLRMAYDVAKEGGNGPCVLNAANEEAVAAYLSGAVPFIKIPEIIEKVLSKRTQKQDLTLSEILEEDRWAREVAQTTLGSVQCS